MVIQACQNRYGPVGSWPDQNRRPCNNCDATHLRSRERGSFRAANNAGGGASFLVASNAGGGTSYLAANKAGGGASCLAASNARGRASCLAANNAGGGASCLAMTCLSTTCHYNSSKPCNSSTLNS